MTSLQDPYDDCNPQMVETLIAGAQRGMARVFVPDITTTSELMSAAFTFLDRTLRSIRMHQTAEERFDTAAQIKKALDDMIVDHGQVPS